MLFYYPQLLYNSMNDDCTGAGGPIAFNKVNGGETNRMTSDGITTEDWQVVQDYATKIANAACSDNDRACDLETEKLRCYLDELQRKYGKRPSILATMADYAVGLNEKARLFQEAYELAKNSGDRKNETLVASSLTELFVDESGDVSLSEKWLALLADALGNNWDDSEYQEFLKLTTKVDSLRRQKGDSEGISPS